MARQQIRGSRMEEGKRSTEHHTKNESWWKSDSGSTVVCFIPAVILDSITSAAMFLSEREFEKPWPQGWTLVMQGGMELFTVVMFVGCRYGDYMLWREDRRSLRPFRGDEVVVGIMGVLNLLVMRLLCEAFMPALILSPA